ncbi:MAG: MBOAT family protein [Clostridia bacterium]|nr:MBOAT family protein [Clostridia bacterium]MBQ9967054.1 MBOAT family protein [Clostridia bacterium]
MIFSSPMFFAVYLPVVLVLYYLSPRKVKNLTLFILSLIFYGWGEPVYVSLMLFSTVLDYTCGRMVDKYRGTKRSKLWLCVSVCANLGLLGIFKYSGFVVSSVNSLLGLSLKVPQLALPIGISFYTFQTMSYTIDVYRGEAPVQKDIIAFGTYVTLFPQLIAGPIVRYLDVAEQMKGRGHSFDKFGVGASRFVCGMSKKVLIANTLGRLWELMSQGQLSLVGSWLGIICYAFQIYFDFSGYSDMAIGLGHMLGFTFPENFNYPYVSRSITEFWRRWHISLGTWFREYLYIPLGGNRKGPKRQVVNMLAVWLFTGIWHGAGWNFLLWGLYYFVLLSIEKLFLLKHLKKLPVISNIYTLVAVLFGWVLFAFEDMGMVMTYAGAMLGSGVPFINSQAIYYLTTLAPLLMAAAVGSTQLPQKAYAALTKKDNIPAAAVSGVLIAAGLIASLAYLVAGTYNPFLYFRF